MKSLVLGFFLSVIYSLILLPRRSGNPPKLNITLYPIFYNSMIIIPISKTKAIHLHHWIFLSILVLFLKKYFLNKNLLNILIGFFLGLVIQGLTYNDAYDLIVKNPYYKNSVISSLSIKYI